MRSNDGNDESGASYGDVSRIETVANHATGTWRRALPSVFMAQAVEVLAALPSCCTEPGFVYFVQSGDLIKIGQTHDVIRRMRDLQAQTATELRLITLTRGVWFERFLHSQFARSRHHGEWFTASTIGKWIHRTARDYPNRCLSCSIRARAA